MPRDHDEDLRELNRDDAQLSEPSTPDAAPAESEGQPPAPPKKTRSRRLPLLLLGAAAMTAVIWYGYDWWTVGRFQVSTDDAYVAADFAVMSSKISGYVDEVLVGENVSVRAGEPLVKLENGDFRNALESAEAQLASQHATLARIDRQIEVARAGVDQAEAKLVAAQASRDAADADFERYDNLAASDFASRQRLDQARSAKATADATVIEAAAGVASAKADVTVVEAQREEAKAALKALEAARERAQRDLEATVIRAPFDGVVGNRAVAEGDYVTAGKRLLAVVPLGAVYVEANFKETQLGDLAPGMPVTLEVDAFPDREVIGHVESFSPASGSVFSLLPPENATGNFTKVVQRVGVRISVPADVAAEGWLRPGLSVIAIANTKGERAEAPDGAALAAQGERK